MKNLLVFLLACLQVTAFAQNLKGGVYVLIEEDAPHAKRCGTSNELLKSAAEGALRHNRIAVAYKLSTTSTVLYLKTNVLQIGKTQFCSSAHSIEFKTYGDVLIPGTKKTVLGDHIFCTRDNLLHNSTSELQKHLTDLTKSYVDQCISEVEKL